MASIATETQKRTSKEHLAAGGVALALMALTAAMGIATWQGTAEQSAPSRIAPSQAVTMATPDQPTAGPTDGEFTIILASSPEQAFTWEAAIAANADAAGKPMPANVHMLVAGTAEEATQARQIIAQAELDSPTGGIRVVDLRGS